MLDKIFRPSLSSWAALMFLVSKKGGGRVCIDFRGLNSKTYLDGTWKSGYWQFEMEADSISKTAFTTSGLYEFLHLPFGLKNSAATFQRLMELVLKSVKGKSCFVYTDDVVVYSKSEQEHLAHLRAVLQCLSRAGLTLRFLDGIKTDPAKV